MIASVLALEADILVLAAQPGTWRGGGSPGVELLEFAVGFGIFAALVGLVGSLIGIAWARYEAPME
jgi:hypothetical protein